MKILALSLLLAADFCLAGADGLDATAGARPVAVLVPWLLDPQNSLEGIPFPEVVAAATGKKVLAVDLERDAALLDALQEAVGRAVERINGNGHPAREAVRINEAGTRIEDEIRAQIAALPGWKAAIPPTADGNIQRSGYPDILATAPNGAFLYIDPKLFDEANRSSSLRTFYYEPKVGTNKIGKDALHLLVGLCHNGKSGPDMRILSWELVDLSKLRVRLKAEFQAGNREMYAPEGILRSGRPANRN